MSIFKTPTPRLQRGDRLARGLVGSWQFSEVSGLTAFDSSGHNNHGILTNSPPWVAGRAGSALLFNGSDQWVDAAANISAGDRTVSAWIKPSSIVAFSAALYTNAPLYLGMSTGGSIWFRSDTDTVTGTDKFSLTGVVVAGVWTLITGVHTGGNVYIYANDNLSNGAQSWAGTPKAFTAVQIATGSGANKFPGLIEDVRIYNRALSADEIRLMYVRSGP